MLIVPDTRDFPMTNFCGLILARKPFTKHGAFYTMLLLILQILQAFVGVVLIALVMIHSPKGDGIGGIGGAAQLFTSQRGAEAGLNKLTAWIIGFFFLLSAVTGFYGQYLAE
jgi:preprotein translocase subunit SecG